MTLLPPTRTSAPRPTRRAPLAAALLAVVACGPEGPPDYASDIAPILYENCAPCHRAEGVAPFELLSYEHAVDKSRRIRTMVSERRMPPWLPRGGVAFHADRRLSDAEVTTIVEWIDAGTPRGDPAEEPAPPTWPSGWALGTPDLVLTMPDTFTVPATGADLFRNFVLPVPLEEGRWIRAVEMRPGNPRVVHHATMRVDETSSSRIADAQDPLPGWDELFSSSMAHPPGGFFLGWTPGKIPTENPEGMAWRLEPGMDYIVQLHLRPTGEEERVASQVGFYFADDGDYRIPLIVRLGGETMDIPPEDSAYVVEDSFQVPVAIELYGVYPHAHFLGRSMDAWADTPSGQRLELVHIPEWDFKWQDSYRYAEPIELPAGSTIRMRYVYDNSASNPSNPYDPPRRVVYGPTSADEMAELWLQALPTVPGNMTALSEALQRDDLVDRIARYRYLLTVDPDHADSHFGLGVIAQARGDTAEAVRRYRLAIDADPRSFDAHYNLGVVLETRGELTGARLSYQEALDANPDYPPALSSLGRLLAVDGQPQRAIELLERAVALDPARVEALNDLGSVLLESKRPQEAEGRFRDAVARRPDFAVAHFNLAVSLIEQGRAEEGLPHLNEGLAYDPSNVQAALSVAWLLATSSRQENRRPVLAADLASQIRAQTGLVPAVADVQAAAYAATGDYPRAVAMAEEALSALDSTADAALRREIEARLELYRARRPSVQPGG
jgi:tetratricopeptide (TPR) repeat protein